MATYSCPMHPNVTLETKGYCYKCGMQLTPNQKTHQSKGKLQEFMPLLIIVGLILLVSLLAAQDLMQLMRYFMAGFFIVFSGFKFLDLSGFAQAYATYDLLAAKWYKYGYIYPFIELVFGILLILNVLPLYTNIAIVAVMGFSGLGVLAAVTKKQKFKCACLGTKIDLPLTTVTLLEDFGMAMMALLTVWFII